MIVTCAYCVAPVRRYKLALAHFCNNACRKAHSHERIVLRMQEEARTGLRACSHCKIEKSRSEFHLNPLRRDGFSSWRKVCELAGKKRREARHPEKKYQEDWRAHLKYAYGLTVERYHTLLAEQSNCCAICETFFTSRADKLCVDHDHDTDEVRGLLCRRCNSAIGLLQEDHVIVQKAATYLKEKSPNTRARRIEAAFDALELRLAEKQSLQGAVLKLAEEDR